MLQFYRYVGSRGFLPQDDPRCSSMVLAWPSRERVHTSGRCRAPGERRLSLETSAPAPACAGRGRRRGRSEQAEGAGSRAGEGGGEGGKGGRRNLELRGERGSEVFERTRRCAAAEVRSPKRGRERRASATSRGTDGCHRSPSCR